MNEMVKPPFRHNDFMPRDIELERRADGSMIMRSRIPLKPIEPHVPSFLQRWARERPEQMWLGERGAPDGGWKKLTYGQAKQGIDALTQALLDLDAEGPVAILSRNSIEHAMLAMAAMQARMPAAPVSPAYSLISQDHVKLKYIFDLLRPAVVMVQDGLMFEKALGALDLAGVKVIYVDHAPRNVEATSFAELLKTKVTPAVEASIAAITPDTIGKLLFTSGSTGMPKAVINTQRMMTANVAMAQQVRQRGPKTPTPIVLDWLPWNHTMGGNASFNAVLADGGMFYIDEGRPVPGLIDATLRNLRDVSPTYYSNVPAGFAMLSVALDKDDGLREGFFKNLTLVAYGGAALSDDLYEKMQQLSIRTTGQRIVFFTGWGSTETAPTATSTYWETERVGLIGLPHPGVELKLIPVGPKYELRLRGIIVMPGYYKQPELTAAAFDEEGFYKIGDAGTFVDENDPAQGMIFAGRVVEDFKLDSGTFVHVGPLRLASIAAATPAFHDALVAGQDKHSICLLAWPNVEACRNIAGLPGASADELITNPKVMAHVRAGIAAHNAANPQSSARIARVLMMAEPASIDGNELTDKGYINQRAALERRAGLVAQLYAEMPAADVIVL